MFRLALSLLISTLILSAGTMAPAGESESAGARVEAPSLESLLSHFASMRGFAANFVEDRHLTLLERPLVSRGRLFFTSPDTILRVVYEPFPSAVWIDGAELKLNDGVRVRRLDLQAQPLLGRIVDALRLVLAGDAERMRALYRVDFQTREADAWLIRLRPREDELAALLAEIELAGHGRELRLLRMREPRGDETVLRFGQVEEDRVLGQEELARLFDLETR